MQPVDFTKAPRKAPEAASKRFTVKSLSSPMYRESDTWARVGAVVSVTVNASRATLTTVPVRCEYLFVFFIFLSDCYQLFLFTYVVWLNVPPSKNAGGGRIPLDLAHRVRRLGVKGDVPLARPR